MSFHQLEPLVLQVFQQFVHQNSPVSNCCSEPPWFCGCAWSVTAVTASTGTPNNAAISCGLLPTAFKLVDLHRISLLLWLAELYRLGGLLRLLLRRRVPWGDRSRRISLIRGLHGLLGRVLAAAGMPAGLAACRAAGVGPWRDRPATGVRSRIRTVSARSCRGFASPKPVNVA